MTVETPPTGSPSLRPDPGAVESVNRVESAVLALRGLAAELRSRGVEVREDGVCGVVDAGPSTRPQQALLRPHRGGLWWWMRWPIQDGLPSALAGVPISPVTRTSDAARRIVGALSTHVGDG
ncbi:hypothetical protein [Nocardiopsis halotolerans]|uniref:hypothetical protein n=1 Tax=Nocardiopsis halotolerans TaxID=124252 RepID=UPI000346C936|nr:hypothetical protein [Nocardiopsis halotolerans]